MIRFGDWFFLNSYKVMRIKCFLGRYRKSRMLVSFFFLEDGLVIFLERRDCRYLLVLNGEYKVRCKVRKLFIIWRLAM